MEQFRKGDTVYIVESERIVRKGIIMKCTGGLYLLKFDGGGGTYVKRHRLYHSEEEAQGEINRVRKLRNPVLNYCDVRLNIGR